MRFDSVLDSALRLGLQLPLWLGLVGLGLGLWLGAKDSLFL